jgi:hypothetical protein
MAGDKILELSYIVFEDPGLLSITLVFFYKVGYNNLYSLIDIIDLTPVHAITFR